MYFYAHDPDLGLLISRHTADGSAREAITELGRVMRVFDLTPSRVTPKIHFMEIEASAPLPGLADRALLAEVPRKIQSPTWFAMVSPSLKVRLMMDIVYLLAPPPPHRRVQSFASMTLAEAWLLTARPDARARIGVLQRELAARVAAAPRKPLRSDSGA